MEYFRVRSGPTVTLKQNAPSPRLHIFRSAQKKTLELQTAESKKYCMVSSGGVGAKGMVTKCVRPRGPGTNTKRSQVASVVMCIAFNLGNLRAWLVGVTTQS